MVAYFLSNISAKNVQIGSCMSKLKQDKVLTFLGQGTDTSYAVQG